MQQVVFAYLMPVRNDDDKEKISEIISDARSLREQANAIIKQSRALNKRIEQHQQKTRQLLSRSRSGPPRRKPTG